MTLSISLKKVIYVFLALGLLASVVFSTGRIDALFRLIHGNLRMTGTVVAVDDSSFTVDTGGTDPFDIQVSERTRWRGGLEGLQDLGVGDDVQIRALNPRNDDSTEFTARRVEKIPPIIYGYGTGCDRLRIIKAEVLAVNPDEIIVESSGIASTIATNENTRIRGYKGARTVNEGDYVLIRGFDCFEDGFVAERIIVLPPQHDEEEAEDNGAEDEGRDEEDTPENPILVPFEEGQPEDN